MQHATHPVAKLATPATAAHESGPGAAETYDDAAESDSVPAEAVLPEGVTATGEPVDQPTSSVALLLDTSASPVITLVPCQKAIDQSLDVAMTDSTGFALLPSASGLTGSIPCLLSFAGCLTSLTRVQDSSVLRYTLLAARYAHMICMCIFRCIYGHPRPGSPAEPALKRVGIIQ